MPSHSIAASTKKKRSFNDTTMKEDDTVFFYLQEVHMLKEQCVGFRGIKVVSDCNCLVSPLFLGVKEKLGWS